MKLPPDDAPALRMALEPLIQPYVESNDSELALTSIAISVKRIADILATDIKDEEFEEPIMSFDVQTGDLVVNDKETVTIIRAGVVWIKESDLELAARWGWRPVEGIEGKPVDGLVRTTRK
jgi:hypothetical protein